MSERDYGHNVADVVDALADYAEEKQGKRFEMPSEYGRGYARGYYRALLMAKTIAQNPDHLSDPKR